MTTNEYRQLWQQAIHLCEIEPDSKEAINFVRTYENFGLFDTMDCKTLILTFTALVVFEKKYQLKYGSTTPASHCYRRLLSCQDVDSELILDIGDWSADYSDNEYIPMDNYRGYGPRKYFAFQTELYSRQQSELELKEERLKKKREAGLAKVEAAKKRKAERLAMIDTLRGKTVREVVSIIKGSNRCAFYFKELIEDWFCNGELSKEEKEIVISLLPYPSTKHNNKIYKKLLQNC